VVLASILILIALIWSIALGKKSIFIITLQLTAHQRTQQNLFPKVVKLVMKALMTTGSYSISSVRGSVFMCYAYSFFSRVCVIVSWTNPVVLSYCISFSLSNLMLFKSTQMTMTMQSRGLWTSNARTQTLCLSMDHMLYMNPFTLAMMTTTGLVRAP
jgi:hypothetical protein